jgi:hypothetical protein
MLPHLDLESDAIVFSILIAHVRRLFTRLSDIAPAFIVADAVFAPTIFAPSSFAPSISVFAPGISSTLGSPVPPLHRCEKHRHCERSLATGHRHCGRGLATGARTIGIASEVSQPLEIDNETSIPSCTKQTGKQSRTKQTGKQSGMAHPRKQLRGQRVEIKVRERVYKPRHSYLAQTHPSSSPPPPPPQLTTTPTNTLPPTYHHTH